MMKWPAAPLPGGVPGDEPHASVEDVDGGLARVLVLVERLARGERDQGLAQRVLVPAVHRPGAASAGRGASNLELLTGQRLQ